MLIKAIKANYILSKRVNLAEKKKKRKKYQEQLRNIGPTEEPVRKGMESPQLIAIIFLNLSFALIRVSKTT